MPIRGHSSAFAELWDHFPTAGGHRHIQCALEDSDGLGRLRAHGLISPHGEATQLSLEQGLEEEIHGLFVPRW